MKNIIIPTNYRKDTIPLIFLGGPVRNAPDWRNYAAEFIRKIDVDKKIYIGFPTPTKKGEDEFNFEGINLKDQKNNPIEYIKPELRDYVITGAEDKFPNYRSWKEYHEETAARAGVLLFWIPEEHKKEDTYREYGINTADEIEYWTNEIRRQPIQHQKIRISVGIEGTFKLWNEEDYDRIFRKTNIKIEKTLEDTLIDAINKCRIYNK
ncbi:MAG TPA: hypothetical protein VEC16_05155 [Alphaproteobacteria bacterium]|nr:hypothetical protein [Alphaproteobacteria bacterium]